MADRKTGEENVGSFMHKRVSATGKTISIARCASGFTSMQVMLLICLGYEAFQYRGGG